MYGEPEIYILWQPFSEQCCILNFFYAVKFFRPTYIIRAGHLDPRPRYVKLGKLGW